MPTQHLNLQCGSLDLANLKKTRDKCELGNWSLRYNSSKNSPEAEFSTDDDQSLAVSITNSTGWVRLMRPLDVLGLSGVYSMSLSTTRFARNPKSNYHVQIYSENQPHNFVRLSRLEIVNGMYWTRLQLEGDSNKYWLGIESEDEAITYQIHDIELKLAPISDEIAQRASNCRKLDLPVVESAAVSEFQQKLKALNQSYSTVIQSDELGTLMEYSSCVRRLEMSETFVRLVRYLVLRYSEMTLNQRKLLFIQIKHALTISHDKPLIALIERTAPEILFQLDLNDSLLEVVGSLQPNSLQTKPAGLDRNALFKYQNDPGRLIPLIREELVKNKLFFDAKPEICCAIANGYVTKPGIAEKYLSYSNRYLKKFDLPRIKTIDFQQSNVLCGIEFEAVENKVDGPLVTIVMSAYNAEETVAYAVKSLLMQTYKNIEILVCDDQSSDNTYNVLVELQKTDDRIRLFQSIKNQGTYNIRNDMIAESHGEFITFHDSDDIALPTRIEEQVQTLVFDDCLLCYTNFVRMSPDGAYVFFHDGMLKRYCAVTAMAHKSLFKRMPKFRSSLVGADTEFYERCKSSLGEKAIKILPKPLLFCLWGTTSLTKLKGLNAEKDGFVANKRRAYGEIGARQRVLGSDIVTDSDVIELLNQLCIYKEPAGSTEFSSVRAAA